MTELVSFIVYICISGTYASAGIRHSHHVWCPGAMHRTHKARLLEALLSTCKYPFVHLHRKSATIMADLLVPRVDLSGSSYEVRETQKTYGFALINAHPSNLTNTYRSACNTAHCFASR